MSRVNRQGVFLSDIPIHTYCMEHGTDYIRRYDGQWACGECRPAASRVAPVWTRGQPNVAGAYWVRLMGLQMPYLAQVYWVDDGVQHGEICGNTTRLEDVMWWCGPLPLPPLEVPNE